MRTPYLTRLATFISPEEMNKDPEFVFNPDLPELSNVHTATAHVMCGATSFTYCNAPVRVDIPDNGGSIWFNRTPSCGVNMTVVDSMPSLAVAWLRAEAGEGQPAVDNRAKISSEVSANNDAFHSPAARAASPRGFGRRAGGAGRAGGPAPATQAHDS